VYVRTYEKKRKIVDTITGTNKIEILNITTTKSLKGDVTGTIKGSGNNQNS
jgi:hypothetical protein